MLKSRVPIEMNKRDMKPGDLVDAGISQGLAYKIYSGDTRLTLSTLEKLCNLLDAKFLDDLIEYTPD